MKVISIRRLGLLFMVLLVLLGIVYLLQAKWLWRGFYPLPYKENIIDVAVDTGVDPFLIAAVTKVESGFDPNALSSAGAMGLMQIMPSTASWAAQQIGLDDFHVDHLSQPEVNLYIGCWYLSDLFREFDGNTTAALAAYNAGRGNVGRWLRTGQWDGTRRDLKDIPFSETREYVKSVLRNYEIYLYLYE